MFNKFVLRRLAAGYSSDFALRIGGRKLLADRLKSVELGVDGDKRYVSIFGLTNKLIGLSDTVIRMWLFYLRCSAGRFEESYIGVVQQLAPKPKIGADCEISFVSGQRGRFT